MSKKSVTPSKPLVKAAARTGTIKEYASTLILSGRLTTDKIVDSVRVKFPKSAFNGAHVSWYRGHLTSLGHKVPAVVVGSKPAAIKKTSKTAVPKKSAGKPVGKKATPKKSAGKPVVPVTSVTSVTSVPPAEA